MWQAHVRASKYAGHLPRYRLARAASGSFHSNLISLVLKSEWSHGAKWSAEIITRAPPAPIVWAWAAEIDIAKAMDASVAVFMNSPAQFGYERVISNFG
ncbi:hypothetical protein BA011_27740 (plasmid) [Rhizobium leguminosarum]|uniref:Uncharacterized protein n=1 Tax=Rhizobium leguminosarum TaxID=384 RepID=A0A1B1CIG1_RHILE|nr:hypothetical protein BA011_27740 [Rhizobium leguminosarum]